MIAGCAALLLLAGCRAHTSGTLSPLSPTSATASALTSAGAGPSAHAPSAADPAQARGVSVAGLAGTWTGDVFVRGWDVSITHGSQVVNPSKDTTWATTVTIGDCTPGATCGSVSYATPNAWGTGEAVSCEGSLKFRGRDEARGEFQFDESITSRSGAVAATSTSRNCRKSILEVTPLASGTTVAVEERDNTWLDYGFLVKSATP